MAKTDILKSNIVVGDSRDIASLLPHLIDQVTLVVTSPPYHNAISYENHAANRDSDWRERSNQEYCDGYLNLMGEVWKSCHRMLRPGGYLVINAGSVLEAGYQYPLPQDLVNGIMTTGEWEFLGTVVWNKVTAGVKRAGSVIQKRLPGYYYPNIMTEHIVVFRKPGCEIVQHRASTPAEWWETVWDIAPVPPKSVDHPAPFPEEIPHRFIRMLTDPGDVVLDPFVGSGSTTKAAADLGRVPAGVDLLSEYVAVAWQRFGKKSAVRAEQLRVVPVSAKTFDPTQPRRSHGKTRHGAGRSTKGAAE
jgi:DNA modification methylase